MIEVEERDALIVMCDKWQGCGLLKLPTLSIDGLLTQSSVGGKADSPSLYSPIRLNQDFYSCTMNHVNCPQGITIFVQLLDNFLPLFWRFMVLLLSSICGLY